jgi:flagellar motor switch protein FliG
MAAPKKTDAAPESALSGARKAAIFVAALDQESAARVFSHLERAEIEAVSLEIARLDADPPSKTERDAVLKEFHAMHLAMTYVEQGGVGYARMLLEKVLPPDEVRKVIETIEASMKMAPFGFLQKAETENLVTFIQDEHPQTIALLLTYMTPTQAGEVLEAIEATKQREVIKRLATMEVTSPDVVKRLEQALESKLASVMTQEFRKTGGVAQAAEILNLVQRSTERAILEGLEEEDPEMVEQIRRLMFTFDDIIRVNNRGVQNLMKNIDTSQLSLALKTASPELREKFFSNMSKRAAEIIREEMEFMGPVRLADVEAAQQAVVDVVRKLEEQGELIVEGRGGAEEIVV